MGMYDRDYQQIEYGQQPGMHLRAPKSMTVKLIIVTAVIYVLQLGFQPQNGPNLFNDLFSLRDNWYLQPWRLFELLSYGFLHDTQNMWHLLGNMFMLWMFGRHIEEKYGRQEFLAIYLTAIVAAALCWNVSEILTPGTSAMLGASGGVSAILLLFIFNYPKVQLLLMFVFPVPAWVLGVFVVGSDMLGAITRQGTVAFTAHLGGFLFAFLYYRFGWRVMDWVPANLSLPSLKRRPPLRVHQPSGGDDENDPMAGQVDRILRKINEEGQASLTAKERRTLERASRVARKKRE